MKLANLFIGIIAATIVVFCHVAGYAFDDGDFEYWSTAGMSWKFHENWKAKIEEEFRFADDMQDFYFHHSDLGLSYSGLADWLDLEADYYQVYEEKSNVWKHENRPCLGAVVKLKVEEVSFSNRCRFEYRHKEDSDHFWRYRNKATVKLPLKIAKYDIQPYIADEIFYDFDAEDINANRLYAGVTFKVFKQLNGDFFYLWQSKKSNSDWIDSNILGTKFKVSF